MAGRAGPNDHNTVMAGMQGTTSGGHVSGGAKPGRSGRTEEDDCLMLVCEGIVLSWKLPPRHGLEIVDGNRCLPIFGRAAWMRNKCMTERSMLFFKFISVGGCAF